MKKYILSILSLFIIIMLYINFNGGILFRTDVSYIGVLENLETKEKKNIFLASAALGNVGWLNNSTIFFQDKQLPIDRVYNFRKANE